VTYVERVYIEEGFLDGLDIEFVPGLNVVIGARGTGKTSLIELMRFCLDVKAYTQETARRSREHALSVLGTGQITVVLSDGQRRVTVTRTSSDDAPRASAPFSAPILFSQTEIESVGLQANARLRLIDTFVDEKRAIQPDDISTVSAVRSLTAEANSIRREVEEIEHKILQIPLVNQQLAELAPAEQQVSETSIEAAEKKAKVDALSAQIAATAVSVSAINRFRQSVLRWGHGLSIAAADAQIEPWPAGEKDPIGQRTSASANRSRERQ
jgi:DNA repair ATPase RecN